MGNEYDDEGPPFERELRRESRHAPERFRMLPASDIGERGVVCSFLLAFEIVGSICAERGCSQDWFHNPALGTIYAVCMERWGKGGTFDNVTLTQFLADSKQLDQVGGAATIAELFTYLPTATNLRYYLDILYDKFVSRQIITVGTEFASRGYEEHDDAAGLLGDFERKVLAIGETHSRGKASTSKEIVMEAIGQIQDCVDRKGSISGIATGFDEIDELTDGLHPGELIVIGARPSHGKTALAMNIADYIAVELQLPIAIFSLEMSKVELMKRMLSARARVDLRRLARGAGKEADYPNLTAAASRLAEAKIIVEDTAGLTIQEVRSKARRFKAQHGIRAIFFDYLQLGRSASRRAQESRQVEVAEVSTGLKEIARELELPLIALAQINRSFESRGQTLRPRMADLKESGAIEQDADVIGFLVREELLHDDEEKRLAAEGKAELIIAKQRSGPLGDIPLTFLKEYTRFETRADREPELFQ